jgi:hypothetical protein
MNFTKHLEKIKEETQIVIKDQRHRSEKEELLLNPVPDGSQGEERGCMPSRIISVDTTDARRCDNSSFLCDRKLLRWQPDRAGLAECG